MVTATDLIESGYTKQYQSGGNKTEYIKAYKDFGLNGRFDISIREWDFGKIKADGKVVYVATTKMGWSNKPEDMFEVTFDNVQNFSSVSVLEARLVKIYCQCKCISLGG